MSAALSTAATALGTAAAAVALVVALVVLVLTATAVVRRPQRGLLLLAALVPFHGLLALVPGGERLAGWKEALLLLVLAAAAVQRWRLRGAAGPAPWLPWWPVLAALVALGSVSALLTAGLPGVAAVKVTFFWTSVLLVLALAPFDARDRDHLVTVLMVVGPVTAAVGLWQQVVGGQFLVDLGYTWDEQVRTAGGFLRSFGTSVQPFPYALLLMTSLVVGVAVALEQPRRLRNTVFLVLVPLVVAGMAVSVVRAAYLGAAVGLVWVALHRHRRLGAALLALAAAALVALPWVPASVLGAATSSTSLGQRTGGWAQITDALLSNPFGQGLGTTGSAAEKLAAAAGRSTADVYQPDSYWVKMALELGPVGLWLFALVVVGGVAACLHTSRALHRRVATAADSADAALALGVSAATLAAAAAATVATYWEIFPVDLWSWLLLGTAGCAASQHAARTRTGARSTATSAPARSAPARSATGAAVPGAAR